MSAEHLGSTMKLFSSLGLSPSDLDALAQIPEDQISVETLPHILRQLKSRKSRDGYGDWDEPREGSREGPGRELSYRQDSSQSYGLNYGSSSRDFSQLYGMAPPSDSSGFMQRVGQPSQGKIEDFLGLNPSMFPHVCSLCDFDVHSILEWNQHTSGLRHAENKRLLLNLYPDWEPSLAPSRSGGLEPPNRSAGILGPAPMSSGPAPGLGSGWGGGPGLSRMNSQGQNMRSRVVMVKYDQKPLSNKSLFNFVEPFGRVREHLLLKNKAFLEMNSHDEALDVVNYYQQNPASLGGKPLFFELSKRLVIEKQDMTHQDRRLDQPLDRPLDRPLRDMNPGGSQVVYFSNLPREEEKKRDLLTIAGRFGTVEKHLFLAEEGFVQLGSPRDAEMMVKYYTMNSLVIRGRPVRLNMCAKYKTLNLDRRPGAGRRADSGTRTSSSRSRQTQSSRSSPSPRRSSDMTNPSPKSRPREERKKDEKSRPKAEPVKESWSEDEAETKRVEEVADTQKTLEEEPEKLSVPDEKDTPEELGGAEGGLVKEGEPEEKERDAAKDENMAEIEEGLEGLEDLEGELPEDEDFMENMDDMVVLDELGEEDGPDAIDSSKKGGMKVVIVIGFRRGYNFLNELMQLAKPFGKVVRHLVLDMRPKAYLQFSSEEEAVAMTEFYKGNVTATVCGRPVKISHYTTHPTIQCGTSRVVYIGQIPGVKFSDKDILKFAEPFGKVQKYFIHPVRRECFLEMQGPEEAERLAEHYRAHAAMFHGKRLTIYVSRKYKELRGRHVQNTDAEKKASKREKSPSPAASQRQSDEPLAKKQREEPERNKTEVTLKETIEEGHQSEEKQETEATAETEEALEMEKRETEEQVAVKTEDEQEKEQEDELEEELEKEQEDEQAKEQEDEQEEEREAEKREPTEDLETNTKASEKEQDQDEEEMETNQEATRTEDPPPETKPTVASLPLPPFDPHTPLGVEHVKMGYYCRVCFLFYSNEDVAKKTHCSSKAHYDRLQKYLENEKNKAVKKQKTALQ